MYVTKRQRNISKQVSKDIVESSKVFKSDFDLVRKIDEILLKNRNTRGGASKFNFPRIMNQAKRAERAEKS